MQVLKNQNEKGFTLLELLAVIVILAIIAAIAIPSTQLIINNQRDKVILSDIVHMLESSKMQVIDDECFDKICEYEYNSANNEINFSTPKFNIGSVDFTLGNSSEQIMIWVNFNPDNFKGGKKDKYRELFETRADNKFTEKELLEAIND